MSRKHSSKTRKTRKTRRADRRDGWTPALRVALVSALTPVLVEAVKALPGLVTAFGAVLASATA